MADEELFDKLRRLRREVPPELGPALEARRRAAAARSEQAPTDEHVARDDAEGMPTWLRQRLSSKRAHGRVACSHGVPEDCCEERRSEGSYLARIKRFSGDHCHGHFRLEECAHAASDTLVRIARDPALADLELERAVYLDIETTGLSGGAGTVPFLVALGSFVGGSFELWQGFLRDPSEERAMLAEVAERVAASSGIVSFFGKSFDRHRLEDKMRLHGVTSPFVDLPHLDLYHPFVRLYRSATEDGRLQTAERVLCGVEREDDLPGSFAPEAWFDFLGNRAHRLEAVFRHNEDDVLSLVVLAAHLGRSLHETRADGRALPGPQAARAQGLAKHFARVPSEREEALLWVRRARARDAHSSRELRLLEADLLRLTGQSLAALELYEGLRDEANDVLALRAALELAKLEEHARRDFEAALTAVAAARTLLEVLVATSALRPSERRRAEAELGRRSERLLRKRSCESA